MERLLKKPLTREGLLLVIVLLFILFVYSNTIEKETTIIPEKKQPVSEDPFARLRENMVQTQLKARDITNEQVLEVMQRVPRHKFVDKSLINQAYADHPLPIGYGQTISQPYIVALMTQSLELDKDDKVLEIGTGSGYQAAVLAELVKEVYTIEIIAPLAKKAQLILKNYSNVKVKNADGYFGWKEYAPFDAIIVTCAANHIPRPLIEQLKDGGRLIIPLGSVKYYQTLTLVKKNGNELKTKYISSVRFVPMTGKVAELT
jgi:protein-L-isoaspartate(D-aspartate) O-methyltransferase